MCNHSNVCFVPLQMSKFMTTNKTISIISSTVKTGIYRNESHNFMCEIKQITCKHIH